MSFVAAFGKDLVEWLAPQKGEHILDLGCGTGDLTQTIAASGASVIGLDVSPEMIAEAKEKYPHLTFKLENGENFHIPHTFDAVFSNAALHWMKDAAGVLHSVRRSLKPGGRFVAEFGGKGNIQSVWQALQRVLKNDYSLMIDTDNPWYFPSIGEYTALLEKEGFSVKHAVHFERPVTLKRESGMREWLQNFAFTLFDKVPRAKREEALQHVVRRLVQTNALDGGWRIDYKRIRILAVKEAS